MKIRNKPLKITLIVILLLLLLATGIGILYISSTIPYKGKFFPNTYINGVDCSGMTPSEAEAAISRDAQNYVLTVKFRNNVERQIKGSDINYRFISNDTIRQAVADQNTLALFFERNKRHDYEVDVQFSYDEALLDSIISAIPELQAENMVAPVDASVAYQDGSWVVTDSDNGTTLTPEPVIEAIKEAITKEQPEIIVEDLNVYQNAAQGADSQLLQTQVTQLNEYANANITYTLPDGSTRAITPDMLKGWLVQNADGTYTKDDATFQTNAAAFFKEIGNVVDNVKKERLFDSTEHGTITIPANANNAYGNEVDEAACITKMTEYVSQHYNGTAELEYVKRELGTENHGVGTTYVELDLSEQHLWFYKNGSLVFETTNITSGAMTTWRYTPPGSYALAYKKKDHTMKGEIDPATNEPIYTQHCDYWMPFITNLGIGFHDLSRSSYGGDVYITNGSHGCINMTLSEAGQLYDLIDAGTPVIVYYSQPYTLTKELSPSEKYAQSQQ